ncbi:MAG: hypothetical protein IJQ66_05210 [Clostridia bacterium]|nr:hypothetical protein [Clostridia bacterium]
MNQDYLTSWQKVIFRNYGKVKTELIGKVIGLSENDIVLNAEKLGFKNIKYETLWREKGFVTIIRNNWDILPNDKIAVLLEISEEELNKTLVEYDFLDVKLGDKPPIDSFLYRPLSVEEEKNTDKVRKIVQENYVDRKVKPFDFFADFVEPNYKAGENADIKDRFVSSYCASYSGALLDDDLTDYSEDYLKKLSATGTNGIWLSDTLRNLAEFPFDKSLSPDYKIRVNNLKKLTERCKKFGIKVYLYINEPRSLPEEFFNKNPHLKGQKSNDGTYCLCTSQKEVKDYLYNAVKSLAKSVPLLYAVMTITMSENPTHCYSRPWGGAEDIATDCPRCKNRKPQEVVAEINNIISRALKDGNGYTKLIANVWGWANYAGEDKKEVFETLDLLDRDINVLCVSEYGKEFVRGGIKGKVDDYSISVVGPSEFAEKVLTYAKNKGHNIWAKIQVNNSWECSAVPYLPTFGLMTEHVKRLKKLGIQGLMLGWSLGGYPGGVLPLINSICENDNFDEKKWYAEVYGENAGEIMRAVKIFGAAFQNYPFSVDSIYFGAHNMGCGNLWSIEKQNRESTMVCFTFDDIEKWTYPYGADIYISLMEKLCKEWEIGIKTFENIESNTATKEFISCAKAAFIHFKSALNLAKFSKYKSDLQANSEILKDCLESELKITKELYKIILTDAKIGFEMTNHYYYDENLLLEKGICILKAK